MESSCTASMMRTKVPETLLACTDKSGNSYLSDVVSTPAIGSPVEASAVDV